MYQLDYQSVHFMGSEVNDKVVQTLMENLVDNY